MKLQVKRKLWKRSIVRPARCRLQLNRDCAQSLSNDRFLHYSCTIEVKKAITIREYRWKVL